MILKRALGTAIFLTGSFVIAQSVGIDVDPVMRAKAQRDFNNNQDLPPVPRGLTEPPPLPPPELHTHDIKAKRKSYAAPSPKYKNAALVKKNSAGATKAKINVKKAPVTTNKVTKPPTSSMSVAAKKTKK